MWLMAFPSLPTYAARLALILLGLDVRLALRLQELIGSRHGVYPSGVVFRVVRILDILE